MAQQTVPVPAARLESGKPFRLWYGVAGAPSAWVLLSSLEWFVTGLACADGEPSWGRLSAGGVRLLLVGLAVAAIAAGLGGLLVSFRAWQELSDRHALTQAYGYGVVEYVSIAGVVISGVFLLAIVWTGLPALVVSICEGTR